MIPKVFRILQGQVYAYFDINGDIAARRIEQMCSKCVMSHKDGIYMGKCLKEIHVAACNCPLDAKNRVYDEFCPFGLWHRDRMDFDGLKELNKKHDFVENTKEHTESL